MFRKMMFSLVVGCLILAACSPLADQPGSGKTVETAVLPTLPQPTPTAAPTAVPTTAAQNLANFEQDLVKAVSDRDYAQMQSMMGDNFLVAGWMSEGGFNTPEQAINFFKTGDSVSEKRLLVADPKKDVKALLGLDPFSMVNPAANVVAALFISNWGTYGKDEALFYIAQKPDGGYYWYGLLAARGGFKPQN